MRRDGNVSRLLNRTLTTTDPTGESCRTWPPTPGGRTTDNTVWNFTLKPA